MYTRSFTGADERSTALPPGYDGTAFEGSQSSEKRDTGIALETFSENSFEPAAKKCDEQKEGGGGLFSRFMPLFSSLFSSGDGSSGILKFPKIGTEEILIIATALFLFLSRDGDRECAVILLLLLIVN